MPRSYVREARRRGLGRRRERIGPIIERLAMEHADAQIALRFRSDLELLVSVMLSAQTTDVNVNQVTPALFGSTAHRRTTWPFRVEELERDIYATGFFRQKAKAIRGTMRVLSEEFDGQVPRRLEDLVSSQASRARRPTSSPRSSVTRKASSSTRTSGDFPSASDLLAMTIP